MNDPRHRRAPPLPTLVLELSEIRCVECGGSAETPYLRPFFARQVEGGTDVFCRLCSPVRMPPARKLNDWLAQPTEPAQEVQDAAA